jgi:hypothetical protein
MWDLALMIGFIIHPLNVINSSSQCDLLFGVSHILLCFDCEWEFVSHATLFIQISNCIRPTFVLCVMLGSLEIFFA